MQQDDYLDLK